MSKADLITSQLERPIDAPPSYYDLAVNSAIQRSMVGETGDAIEDIDGESPSFYQKTLSEKVRAIVTWVGSFMDVINIAFVALYIGVYDGVCSATMTNQINSMFKTDLKSFNVSYDYEFIGSVLGVIAGALVMMRFPTRRNFVVSLLVLIFSGLIISYAHLSDVRTLYIISAVMGFFSAALETVIAFLSLITFADAKKFAMFVAFVDLMDPAGELLGTYLSQKALPDGLMVRAHHNHTHRGGAGHNMTDGGHTEVASSIRQSSSQYDELSVTAIQDLLYDISFKLILGALGFLTTAIISTCMNRDSAINKRENRNGQLFLHMGRCSTSFVIYIAITFIVLFTSFRQGMTDYLTFFFQNSHSMVNITSSMATSLAVLFLIAFTCGRIVITLLATCKVNMSWIIGKALILSAILFGVMWTFDDFTSTIFKVLLSITGCLLATVLPVSMQWFDEHFYLSDQLSAALSGAEILGPVLGPVIIGPLLEMKVNYFMPICLMATVGCYFTYLILYFLSDRVKKQIYVV